MSLIVIAAYTLYKYTQATLTYDYACDVETTQTADRVAFDKVSFINVSRNVYN